MKRTAPALAVLALAGCGGGDDDALTERQLASRADEICERYSREVLELGNPKVTDARDAARYFSATREFSVKQQDEMEKLTPPEDLQDEFDDLIAAFADTTRLLGDLGAASADRDQERIAELLQDAESLTDRVDAAADAIGAEDCASP